MVCIILKNTLYASRAAGKKSSFFIGALLPYCLAWTLYQGKATLDCSNDDEIKYTFIFFKGRAY